MLLSMFPHPNGNGLCEVVLKSSQRKVGSIRNHSSHCLAHLNWHFRAETESIVKQDPSEAGSAASYFSRVLNGNFSYYRS